MSVREPSEGLILTNRHRQERLRWCRARLRWRLNNEWSHVLFLDESRFNLSHSDGRARGYRRKMKDTQTVVFKKGTDLEAEV